MRLHLVLRAICLAISLLPPLLLRLSFDRLSALRQIPVVLWPALVD